MNNFLQVFQDRQGALASALLEHIQISFIALLFAVMISIPLGIFLTKRPRAAEPVIGVTAVLQTIPSLALLGLLIPLFGIGKIPAIIALVVYALLPILRNTYTGIKEVDPSLIEAARAMGMDSRKRLIKVELPLAMPVIMAGIRTAMVLIIGTATLAALIGAGGLGDLILLGIDRNNSMLIVLGAVPAALLAILFDFLLRSFERMTFKRSMTTFGILGVVALLVVIVPFAMRGEQKDIVIAGKLGSEPEILINMYKLLIEKDTDLNVELKPGLGKTSFVFNALKSGSIDVYPEFTGTAISEFLKETASSTDSRKVYEQARKGMADKFDMQLLRPMKYNNTYALAVPRQTADQYNLRTISDLKQASNNINAGFTLEFADREDGYRGIQKKYGIKLANVKTMEPKLRYNAVEKGDINVVDAYSTDSELRQYDLTVLKDDKHLFPPYQGAPLLKKETAEKYPEIKKALNKLSNKITDGEMREMNYKVNVNGMSPDEVAKQYLEKENLL
ncbi:osmoprotectant update ABC transporter permease/substrate-binding subunit OpuFB [Fictibacillus terranigra]|uniref:Osmoprotectant update ABC transporter permease/substrate-binding subunit OpuFB n=1 Tax=Fictibacillus terranigra TaxID=3058424 RepID=A0ABT8E8I9_9BACL|nr:osmoprotectant update ABC transporter permease/substrate-binding subunit OpuFB [Fictibacillus sp. CENA-BCM004]MDN4074212.1 osmoprotectant update ABC transporter permease/substrate-binding subunit OpuFB [Fictibacillus sp. CENA-BCM004]